MRRIIVVLIFLLVIPAEAGIHCFSQTSLDTCKQNFLIARETTKKVRDSLKIIIDAGEIMKHEIYVKDTIIIQLKLNLHDKDAQLENLKRLTSSVTTAPLFVWQGFYAGISAQYNFNDSILTKATVLNGLNYAIETHAGVIIADKLLLDGLIGIPLSKQKIFVKAFIGWKIF